MANSLFPGYGYHGDFINAWAPGVLQQAVDQCTNPSGDMRDCPVFSFHSDSESCALQNALPAQIISENVIGPMKGLPNGVPIQSGPEPATKIAGYGASESNPIIHSSQPAPATTSAAKVPTVPIVEHQPTSIPLSRPEPGSGQYSELNVNYVQMPTPSPSSSSSPPPPSTPKPSTPSSSEPQLPNSPPSPVLSPSETPSYAQISASSRPPSTLSSVAILASTTTPIALHEQAITTKFWTSGREVHEVIVMLTEVYVTPSTATVTMTASANTYHKRHTHNHHAMRGIGGRLLR